MIKKHIPNFITCCNLFCGCLAIVAAFRSELSNAGMFVGLALLFDFFDGFAARLLKVQSEIGKQLDSLADMVSFGVVPGVVMYHMIGNALTFKYGAWNIPSSLSLLPLVSFVIPVLSAVRLAKFNLDTRQTHSFIGLPTPANAVFICVLPLVFSTSENKGLFILLLNPMFLAGLSIVMSLLLIAEIPLFALKFKNFGWTDNKIRYVFIVIAIAGLLFLKLMAVPLLVIFYIILSLIENKVNSQPKI